MKNEKHLSVGNLPGRKRPCIYVQEGACIRTIGSFYNEAAMQEFLAFAPTFTPQPVVGTLVEENTR